MGLLLFCRRCNKCNKCNTIFYCTYNTYFTYCTYCTYFYFSYLSKKNALLAGERFYLCVDICVVSILLDELAAGRYVVTHKH